LAPSWTWSLRAASRDGGPWRGLARSAGNGLHLYLNPPTNAPAD